MPLPSGGTPALTGNLASRLEAARRNVEGKFLAAGDILSQSIRGTESLIASLDTLAKALDSSTVNATTSELKRTAEILNGLPDNHRIRLEALAAMRRSRNGFAECISDMHRALSYMQAFTVNIKIVAGGIDDKDGEFSIFAQDIADCIATGIDKLKRIEADVEILREKLMSAEEQGETLEHKISKLLPPLHAALGKSADAMEAHYLNVATTVESVAALARDIRQNASRILVALQIGDSTRQRIEHVQASLAAAAAKQEWPDEINETVATFVYALLAAHLRGTLTDFDREVAEIDRNMAQMAANARELMKLHDMAFGGNEDGRSFLQDLTDKIAEAQELVGQIEDADRAATQTGHETAHSAQGLSAKVEEIQLLKNDVQYMALNTTLKCCQIGEVGRPLSVIAIELRDHGSRMDEAAEKGLADLGRLTVSVDTGMTAEARAANASNCSTAAEALAGAAARVREARDKTEADIASIAAKGDEVLSMLELSDQRLRFRQDIGEALEGIVESVDGLCTDIQPYTDEMRVPLADALAAIATRYAMVQEREIHRQFAERWELACDDVEHEDDLEDMLF